MNNLFEELILIEENDKLISNIVLSLNELKRNQSFSFQIGGVLKLIETINKDNGFHYKTDDLRNDLCPLISYIDLLTLFEDQENRKNDKLMDLFYDSYFKTLRFLNKLIYNN